MADNITLCSKADLTTSWGAEAGKKTFRSTHTTVKVSNRIMVEQILLNNAR